MFNDNSIIKEVNIITKLLCYIIVFISLTICNDCIYLLFVNLFLLTITRQYNKLFKFNLISIFILLLCFYFKHLILIVKLLILVIYTILLKKVTKAVDFRYILESTLYRFNNKKITYHILYIIYFIRYYRKNIKNFSLLKDDYKIDFNFKFLVFIIKKAYKKTKLELEYLMETSKLRFYNFSNKRTYVEKVKWESWDTNYLVCHVIILLLTIFYGR